MTDSGAPLTDAEFAALMAPFAPFEQPPLLAVAVSGGADSLALCLLAERWARARGGAVTALTVDHGLRRAAAAEAQRVAAWLAPLGIAHRTLVWRPPAGMRNLQAAARAARYRLLEAWCQAAGCLHLLTAHHREDQAETFLLRLARGSGLDGLAAIAGLRETARCQLLRPLLPVPRARLVAILREGGQDWLEDPSNADATFARVRLRRSAATLAGEGLGPERLAATARRLGRARSALEGEVAKLLARAVAIHPAGFARLDAAPLATSAPEITLRALARLVACIGGADHTPRLERLERLGAALAQGLPAGRTLGGCRFLRWRGAVLVCREPALAAPPLALTPGATLRWDGRFVVRLDATAPDGLTVGALGDPSGIALDARAVPLPAAARASLPALRDLVGIVAVPHLHYVGRRRDAVARAVSAWSFRPERSLTGPGFTVV